MVIIGGVIGIIIFIVIVYVIIKSIRKNMKATEAKEMNRNTISYQSQMPAPQPIQQPPVYQASTLGSYCRYCGDKVGNDASFCPKCGSKL